MRVQSEASFLGRKSLGSEKEYKFLLSSLKES